jgi:hypothetical protein
LDEGTDDVALKPLLVVHYVVRNPKIFRYRTRVINIINRAAPPLHLRRHTLATGEAPLIPELHRQPDHIVTVGAEHGRNGGRVHTARHGYRNGLC